jgi:hypothetical protein
LTPPPAYSSYKFDGQREYCLSLGDAAATRRIFIIPPLFDEMNRVRRMLLQAMRAVATRGCVGLLPDLPGCNESNADMAAQTVASWRDAMAAAASELDATHVASLRGGALVDGAIDLPHWRLAPVKGSSLLKTMLRTRIAADKEAGRTVTADQLMAEAKTSPIELSGYLLCHAMLESLNTATPVALPDAREVPLSDIDGSPLWLRAEPFDDPAMSAALAAELDSWSASCGG